jgi:hypothetical protein
VVLVVYDEDNQLGETHGLLQDAELPKQIQLNVTAANNVETNYSICTSFVTCVGNV